MVDCRKDEHMFVMYRFVTYQTIGEADPCRSRAANSPCRPQEDTETKDDIGKSQDKAEVDDPVYS